jgi:hypothetical protein
VPQIPEVVHLATRTQPSRKYDGYECKTVFDQLCCAYHGLSVLISGRRDGQEHRMLFDVGPFCCGSRATDREPTRPARNFVAERSDFSRLWHCMGGPSRPVITPWQYAKVKGFTS